MPYPFDKQRYNYDVSVKQTDSQALSRELPALTLRESRYIQAKIADPFISDRAALTWAGFGPWICAHAPSVVTPEMRALVDKYRMAAVTASLQQGVCDAKEVLFELMRQLARLMCALDELREQVGQDLADLYDEETGLLAPIHAWPEVWRRHLAVEVETREGARRSDDGVQAGESKAWDKDGEIKKVKRESPLAIRAEIRQTEREIRECLKTIGNHVQVKAFPVPGDKLADSVDGLVESINRAISAGRQRAAARITANVPTPES